jgi:hypothetical protein
MSVNPFSTRFALVAQEKRHDEVSAECALTGKLVGHILETGLDVYVYQRPGMLALRMSKLVGKELLAVDWTLSQIDLTDLALPEYVLFDECDYRLQQLRDEIAKRTTGGDAG